MWRPFPLLPKYVRFASQIIQIKRDSRQRPGRRGGYGDARKSALRRTTAGSAAAFRGLRPAAAGESVGRYLSQLRRRIEQPRVFHQREAVGHPGDEIGDV